MRKILQIEVELGDDWRDECKFLDDVQDVLSNLGIKMGDAHLLDPKDIIIINKEE